MRKIVVLLLVAGLIIGTFTAVASENEENFSQIMFSFEGDLEDTVGDPVLCGGGSDGGGGGAPG
ncbi:MAG: hypothetical protein HXS44_04310 [Theionarchaea archaeon]|nr:hypothetical protein [Theionarchaea archaeon]